MSQLRLQNERHFHDQQAAARARALGPDDYSFEDEAYLRHESWIAPAFATLGDVAGKRVLDLGCGHGMAAVVLARRGAAVTACDLSLGYIREARARAAAAGVRVQLVVCDGACLPFADGAFERIWGNAILHHLDMSKAAAELWRVLAPGGVAVFCEPWGENRALRWARQALPYRYKSRTDDEAPLRRRDLSMLAEQFPGLKVVGHQFLSMLSRAFPSRRLAGGLSWCDDLILRACPSWQRYCRYVVLRAAK